MPPRLKLTVKQIDDLLHPITGNYLGSGFLYNNNP